MGSSWVWGWTSFWPRGCKKQADGGYWEWQKTFPVKWLTFMPAFLYVTLSAWTLAPCILSFLGTVLKKWGQNSNLFRNQADNVIEVKQWKSDQLKHSLTELGSQVLWRETRCHVGSYRQDWGLSFWTTLVICVFSLCFLVLPEICQCVDIFK